ncbi:hypothetical protein HDU67_006587 [Dinochytrium kinnereticum]|nr:hypothetical protein HDU67_006587 [Dinochytrium kinnereticum]
MVYAVAGIGLLLSLLPVALGSPSVRHHGPVEGAAGIRVIDQSSLTANNAGVDTSSGDGIRILEDYAGTNAGGIAMVDDSVGALKIMSTKSEAAARTGGIQVVGGDADAAGMPPNAEKLPYGGGIRILEDSTTTPYSHSSSAIPPKLSSVHHPSKHVAPKDASSDAPTQNDAELRYQRLLIDKIRGKAGHRVKAFDDEEEIGATSTPASPGAPLEVTDPVQAILAAARAQAQQRLNPGTEAPVKPIPGGVTAGPGAKAPALPPYSHIGCLRELTPHEEKNRLLPNRLGTGIGVAACGKLASARGFPYFGVQNGAECWAAPNFYSNITERYAAAEECSAPCLLPTEQKLKCGNHWRISAYAIPKLGGVVPQPGPPTTDPPEPPKVEPPPPPPPEEKPEAAALAASGDEQMQQRGGGGDGGGGGGGGGPGSDGSGEEGETVAAHNKVRDEFGKPHMSWSSDLADAENGAKRYARELADRGCPMDHNPPSGQGENLWAASQDSPFDVPMGRAVPDWCDDEERRQWNEDRSYNHFTQVIWGGTLNVGCGKAMGNNDGTYCVVVVCRYSGPGNFVGQDP